MAGLPNGLRNERGVLPTVFDIVCTRAVRDVQESVRHHANGVIVREVSELELQMYQRIEDFQMQKIANELGAILATKVMPAVVSFVQTQYPSELKKFREVDGGDIFGNVELVMHAEPTTMEDISDPNRIRRGSFIADCAFADEGDYNTRNISFNLEDFLSGNNINTGDAEALEDAMFQVLVHEFYHAVSAKRHMAEEEIEEVKRVVNFREGFLGDIEPHFADLASSFGYAINFIDIGTVGFRTYGGLVAFNEAMTEVFAAKTYAEHTRKKYGKARRYRVNYVLECNAFHRTLKEFASEKKIPLRDLVKKLETGYLFPTESRMENLRDIVLPMMDIFMPTLEAQREAAKPTPVVPELILPLPLARRRSKLQRLRQSGSSSSPR